LKAANHHFDGHGVDDADDEVVPLDKEKIGNHKSNILEIGSMRKRSSVSHKM
jgi:hypothetical protein